MQSWSWSSSSCSEGQQSTGKVVTTTIRNGQKVVTTTYNGGQPQTVSLCERTGASKNAGGATPTLTSSFEKECLDEHNRLRAAHGCPPLTLNRNLCAYAGEWAKNLAARNIFQHRTERKYGENLFMASGYKVDGKTAVKSWYDEIKKYNYSRPGFSGETGHFTQVIWKNTKQMGVAVEKNGNSTYVVANYDPPGNFQSQFPNNVPKLRK